MGSCVARALIRPILKPRRSSGVVIVPPLAERLDKIDHGRTVNLGLDIVPGRFRAVSRVEPFCLLVASVSLVVTASVTQIDATDEGQIVFVTAGVEQQNELLVVRPTPSDASIQKHDPTSIVHDAGKIARLRLVETEHLRMGAPQQPTDLDAACRETGQQSA